MTEGNLNPFRPRRLQIVEPGWAGYTGDFGMIAFKDGVSEHPVPWQEQQRLGGIIRMESADENEGHQQVGPAAELVRGRDIDADHERVMGSGSGVMDPAGHIRLSAETYTEAQLEEIADRDGIGGLRVIGAAWGVKGRSIQELIQGILAAHAAGTHTATRLPAESVTTEETS